MKRIVYCFFMSLFTAGAFAQPKDERQAINNLCGCFEVDFKYAETFAADTAYPFHPRYHARGLEWVVAEEATDKKFVLQHLLLADTFIIKHWREDWEFEKNEWLLFDKDASWNRSGTDRKKIKGQWTQTVWEVDDGPRYQGSGQWILNDRQYYWENTTDAPLPRREYTKRKDYNVMQRRNRIIITDTGWVHEQDNEKILRRDGSPDVVLAGEKGYNIYRKTNDSRCARAAAWWQNHRAFWNIVRKSWEKTLKDRQHVHLLARVNDRFLYQDLDALEEQHLSGEELSRKVEEAIGKHIGE